MLEHPLLLVWCANHAVRLAGASLTGASVASLACGEATPRRRRRPTPGVIPHPTAGREAAERLASQESRHGRLVGHLDLLLIRRMRLPLMAVAATATL